MSNFLNHDTLYDNYLRISDFKAQTKLKNAKRRQRDTNKVIPEIVQQREKERQLKKQVKLELSAKKKNFDIKRAQSRTASGRCQLLNFNAIENDNDLADELNYEIFQELMLYEWYYSELWSHSEL
jgi:hypothetical protein